MIYYSGWLLPEHERDRLLTLFHPKYPKTYAHHITLQYDCPVDDPLPTLTRARLVGICDDYASLEALVFAIGGTTDRPDGSTYHCTWSLDPKVREARDSNDLIRDLGYIKFLHPTMIDIVPAMMEG